MMLSWVSTASEGWQLRLSCHWRSGRQRRHLRALPVLQSVTWLDELGSLGHLHSTMKSLGPLASLLPLSLLFISALPSLAVPSYADAQAVFSQKPFPGVSKDKFESAANGSEKSIERWIHEGKEYIMQDNLLCENHLLCKRSCCWHAVNFVDRWICHPPGL